MEKTNIDFLREKAIQYIKNKKKINEHVKGNKKKWEERTSYVR